jgi:hypothetical protein
MSTSTREINDYERAEQRNEMDKSATDEHLIEDATSWLMDLVEELVRSSLSWTIMQLEIVFMSNLLEN